MDETDVDDVVVALVNCAKRVCMSFTFVFYFLYVFFLKKVCYFRSRHNTNAKASSSSF